MNASNRRVILEDMKLSLAAYLQNSKPGNGFDKTAGTFESAVYYLERSRVVIFDSHLAQNITRSGTTHTNVVDFVLPFEHVFLQFPKWIDYSGKIVGVDGQEVDGLKVKGLLLSQMEISRDAIATGRRINDERGDNLIIPSVDDIGKLQTAMVVICNTGIQKTSWISESFQEFSEPIEENYDSMVFFKRLAISCIGYINCENVYLHQNDGAPDAVNRKRAAKGKATIEPYYTCRIRGVNYDNPAGKGQGTSPGHIFDVRGHFRRLDSGKVTWVRPHLRGLKSGGEYVPKVYTVDKHSHPITAA